MFLGCNFHFFPLSENDPKKFDGIKPPPLYGQKNFGGGGFFIKRPSVLQILVLKALTAKSSKKALPQLTVRGKKRAK